MARYAQICRKSLSFLQKCRNISFYPSLNGLCSVNRSSFCLSRSSHGFHTFIQLNSQENDKKSTATSMKQLYATKTTKSGDAKRQFDANIQMGNINAAKEIYKEWNQKDGFHETPFLTLVNGLLKFKRIDEAKEIITEFKSNGLKSRTTSDPDAILCRIFDSLGNYADIDDLLWFVDNLIFNRERVNRQVLEIIIKSVLWKHRDLDATFNLFDRMACQFRTTPLMLVINCELIKLGDTERLEKLLTIATNLHGKVNSFYDMAFAFTICGRIDQAKRIFESLETEDAHKIESFINNLKMRRKVKDLNNLLVATENYVSKENRAKIFSALLELYAYENDADKDIVTICSAMEKEEILPTDESINKIVKLMQRKNIEIPKAWLQMQTNVNHLESKLQALLGENNMQEANKMLYDSLKSGTPLERNVMRYCLLKNGENGNITIFEDLKPQLDLPTKIQLKFYTYECQAYIKSGKSGDYMKILRTATKSGDLKELAVTISDHVIDMIESNPAIYDEYKDIAINFAVKGVVKPICLLWTYNFIKNTNTSDNQMIWDKYLERHPTIVCNQVAKVLFQRKQVEKLQEFLNLENLNRKYIVKSELGKAYSNLFDGFFYKGDYNAIIEELTKAMVFLSLKDFKPNTISRIKMGPTELSQRFWSVINNSTTNVRK